MNPKDLIDKYAKNKKIKSSDKNKFFELLSDFFSISDLEALWHIVTMKNTSCLKKIFNFTDIALITGAIIYVIVPLDAIPDLIPFAGLIDDATVIGFILRTLGGKISKYREKCMK